MTNLTQFRVNGVNTAVPDAFVFPSDHQQFKDSNMERLADPNFQRPMLSQ